MTAIRAADGCFVSEADGQIAHGAQYFQQLFTVNPPIGQLQTTGLQVADADPPINETVPSLDEVKESVAWLRRGEETGICHIRWGHDPWVACCLDCCMAFRYHSS